MLSKSALEYPQRGCKTPAKENLRLSFLSPRNELPTQARILTSGSTLLGPLVVLGSVLNLQPELVDGCDVADQLKLQYYLSSNEAQVIAMNTEYDLPVHVVLFGIHHPTSMSFDDGKSTVQRVRGIWRDVTA
ncbi:hypothetical protein AB1N83_003552 [Pleurotus pulmonarius]